MTEKFKQSLLDASFLIGFLLLALYLFSLPEPKHTAFEEQSDVTTQAESPAVIEAHIKKVNSSVTDSDAKEIVTAAIKWAAEFQLSPALVLAVVQTESTFTKYAISHAGAFGYMQVLPKWHLDKLKHARKELGNPELFNTDTNIYVGTWILKDCMSKYRNETSALKCYSGNIGNINTDYPAKVLSNKRKIEKYI